MKKLFHLLFFVFPMISISQEYSSYQPKMPCSMLDNNVVWSNVIEDVKDALIIQSLIAEKRFEALKDFLDKNDYAKIQDDVYSKTDRLSLEEVNPIIQIFELDKSDDSKSYDEIGTRIFFRTKPNETYMSQVEHNRIWLFLTDALDNGLAFNMFEKIISFYKEEGSNINFKSKYEIEVFLPNDKTETYSASNFLTMGSDYKPNLSTGTFIGPGSNLWLTFRSNKIEEGDECSDKILMSTLELRSFKEKTSNSRIDIKLFKGMNRLNEIIWQDYHK
jgi:hypothetical protein